MKDDRFEQLPVLQDGMELSEQMFHLTLARYFNGQRYLTEHARQEHKQRSRAEAFLASLERFRSGDDQSQGKQENPLLCSDEQEPDEQLRSRAWDCD
ncbi:MAG: hypothetical protein IH830_04770 [Planctomycetes bacterium]|nr:hypothetical protein [Planctomycetota bacterium]